MFYPTKTSLEKEGCMSDEKKTLKEVIRQQLERDVAMRKPPTWEEIIDDEWKIRHIMEDVMGWECFASWESYLWKYGAQEWELGAGKSYTTPTSVAFYHYYEWRVFSADHEDLRRPFDPLHTMTDAWLVLQKVASFPDDPFESLWIKRSFMCELKSLPCDSPSYYDVDLPLLASWTPEMICRAAYMAAHPEIKPL